jgi:mannosylfructose-phosphate synthase
MQPTSQRLMMISTHGYVSSEPELGLPDTGGQVVYVLELARHLADAGIEVDVLTRQFEDQPATEWVGPGVRLLRFPCGGRRFIPKETLVDHLDEWACRVERFARASQSGYGIIHTHYWDAGYAGARLAVRLGLPHVHTPHSLGVWKERGMAGLTIDSEPDYNFRRRIGEERRIYASVDGLIATTRQQADMLHSSDYEAREQCLFQIPPGYDDDRFYPAQAEERRAWRRRLGWDGPIVLALGRIAANKGYDLLIRAMPAVLARAPRARLCLAIGSSHPSKSEQVALNQLAQVARDEGVEDRVEFRGHIPDDELAGSYWAADVFALSSRYEPFGMTAIEAMACGTPCIITSHGGLCQEIRHGDEAICADPLVPREFGDALGTVLEDRKLWRRLSHFGAAMVRRRFTWRNVAQQVAKCFEVVQGAPGVAWGYASHPVARASLM